MRINTLKYYYIYRGEAGRGDEGKRERKGKRRYRSVCVYGGIREG